MVSDVRDQIEALTTRVIERVEFGNAHRDLNWFYSVGIRIATEITLSVYLFNRTLTFGKTVKYISVLPDAENVSERIKEMIEFLDGLPMAPEGGDDCEPLSR